MVILKIMLIEGFFLPFFIKYIRKKLQQAKGKNSNVFSASREPDAQSLVRIIWVYVPGQKWFHLGKWSSICTSLLRQKRQRLGSKYGKFGTRWLRQHNNHMALHHKWIHQQFLHELNWNRQEGPKQPQFRPVLHSQTHTHSHLLVSK